jgi:glycerol-3-phosphate dehydrogenase (NAD(P)+)
MMAAPRHEPLTSMPERVPLRIAVLGRGAWGSTLAQLWRSQGHQLSCWSRRDGTDPASLLQDVDLAAVAVSMAGVEPLAQALVPHWPARLPLLSCTKGLDLERLTTASRIWCQHGLPGAALVLSGPNLAAELARGLPAASVLACEDQALAAELQVRLSGGNLRLYTNHDPVGTEVAGALKNVMAVAAGLCDGLQLGANARASLLTRGLAEMGVVLEGLGGTAATLYGLAGLGDLLATATSPLSRNYRCGLLLAEGLGIDAALARIDATVEGPRTARAALALAERHGWSLPICEQVVAVIEGRNPVASAARALMERQLRPEALQERS